VFCRAPSEFTAKDFVFKVPFREKSIKVDLKKAPNSLKGAKDKDLGVTQLKINKLINSQSFIRCRVE